MFGVFFFVLATVFEGDFGRFADVGFGVGFVFGARGFSFYFFFWGLLWCYELVLGDCISSLSGARFCL